MEEPSQSHVVASVPGVQEFTHGLSKEDPVTVASSELPEVGTPTPRTEGMTRNSQPLAHDSQNNASSSDPKGPTSSTEHRTRNTEHGTRNTERILYVVIGVLVLLLIGLSLYKRRPISLNKPKLPKKRQSLRWRPGVLVAPFWLPLPKTARKPMVARRIAALRTLYQSYSIARTFWQFSPETHQPLLKAMRSPNLSYNRLLHILGKIPLEEHHFQVWDKALQHAMHRLLQAIAPKYQKYLDEMNSSVPFPTVQTSLALSKKVQRQFRNRLIQRWRQHEKILHWQSWQFSLATERILLYSGKTAKRSHLKRCQKALRQAHQLLQKKEPQHRLLPILHNRIQLYEALLKKLKDR